MASGSSHFAVHGWLMYLSFGLLLPIGIFCVRYMQYIQNSEGSANRIEHLRKAHMWIEITGVMIMTLGVLSSLVSLGAGSAHTHQRLGYVLWILTWLQFLASLVVSQPPV
ncbi:hypothetical protein KP509_22G006800 [Ceratopteris richardii]|uniref:Cytochrome b561 domain-containing protein n=1 Tax=Ceratopteris richardii TaxID=49495 RepID=A0A8T2S3A4_CERRI|nr:hypothetical protein KP509_22G006800 [Ceratopteris richardii]KAH7306328.1 hypothetical protein KP509_22G006800 [Ceratopteris richardii]